MHKKIYETDWLASRPVFYNEITHQVSFNINDVIDFKNLEFHEDGFNNFLDFGYSILGQTPIKNVKFLPHSSRLTIQDDDKFLIEQFSDPVEEWLEKISHEDDVWELLREAIQSWEDSVDGEIIIPTSGGYDSRILNLFIKDKSRIQSFTYGVSGNQSQSFEVVNAQKISEILGTKWTQIPLGDYHLFFDEWDKEFGISAHAHGMYHIEFYQQIISKVRGHNPFLSGIVGDAWSGNVSIPEIHFSSQLKLLSYSHGLNADSHHSRLTTEKNCLLESYYETNREKLKFPIFRVVEAIRFKIVLLSYLLTIPRSFGFEPWSPYLIPEIALSMLTLPLDRKQNRIWQQDFFRKHGLDIESMKIRKTYQNNLNFQAWKRIPLQPLNTNLLASYIDLSYLEWINRELTQKALIRKQLLELQCLPKIGGLLIRLGTNDSHYRAYAAYLTLKPIEKVLLQSSC
jgi:hypothetical protein